MSVYKKLLSVMMIAACLSLSACADNGSGRPAETSGGATAHNGGNNSDPAKRSIADALKDKTMSGYESATIGSAFDSYRYFAKKEWKETAPQHGKIYVDFVGWVDGKALDSASIKEGISARGVDVKFAINPDGSFFVAMVSKIEAKGDGKLYSYPLEDSAAVLTRIYANKEMRF